MGVGWREGWGWEEQPEDRLRLGTGGQKKLLQRVRRHLVRPGAKETSLSLGQPRAALIWGPGGYVSILELSRKLPQH